MTPDHRAQAESLLEAAYELAAQVPPETARADSTVAWAVPHALLALADALRPEPLRLPRRDPQAAKSVIDQIKAIRGAYAGLVDPALVTGDTVTVPHPTEPEETPMNDAAPDRDWKVGDYVTIHSFGDYSMVVEGTPVTDPADLREGDRVSFVHRTDGPLEGLVRTPIGGSLNEGPWGAVDGRPGYYILSHSSISDVRLLSRPETPARDAGDATTDLPRLFVDEDTYEDRVIWYGADEAADLQELLIRTPANAPGFDLLAGLVIAEQEGLVAVDRDDLAFLLDCAALVDADRLELSDTERERYARLRVALDRGRDE